MAQADNEYTIVISLIYLPSISPFNSIPIPEKAKNTNTNINNNLTSRFATIDENFSSYSAYRIPAIKPIVSMRYHVWGNYSGQAHQC